MEKKANTTIVIIIILAVIILLIGLYFGFRDKLVPQSQFPTINETKLLIKTLDSKTNSQLESEVCIYKDRVISRCIKSSTSAWTELTLEINHNYTFFSNKSGYYANAFKIDNLNLGYPKTEILLEKIGDLKITHDGELKEGLNTIIFDVEFIDKFQRLTLCTTWSKGIIYATPTPQPLQCDAMWQNCIKYTDVYKGNRKESLCLEPLEEKKYYCPIPEKFEYCDEVKDFSCYPRQKQIPERLSKLTDKCVYYGRDFNSEKFVFSIDVKTYQLDEKNDYFEVYFIDEDLINLDTYSFEINETDIGKKDVRYEV